MCTLGQAAERSPGKAKREEVQKDLEKMRTKIKSERIERTKSGKETGRMDCNETKHRGTASAQQSSADRQWRQRGCESSCCQSGHSRVHIWIKTQIEIEHIKIQKARKKKVGCIELSSGGGGRQGRATKSSNNEEEQKDKKRKGKKWRAREENENSDKFFCELSPIT